MYMIRIVTQKNLDTTYSGLTGSQEEARRTGIERFNIEHPDETIKDAFVFTEKEYYGFHRCHDRTGLGCCDTCGGVIAGSPMFLEINGRD